MKVERVYTRSVVGTPRSASVEEAAATMRRFHVGTLLVMDNADAANPVAGIVTDRDLVMQVLAEGRDAAKVTIDKVMAPVVASVPESAELDEALGRMRAAGVRRLLVSRDGGGVAGIVSIDDIVDGLVAELANLAAIMKTEVRRETAEFDGPRAPG